MIKKILSTLLVSSALLVFAATGSMAERPTFAVGYTATYGAYSATGQENEGSGTPQEINKDTEEAEIGYSSLFVEMSIADRVTFGVSLMADGVQTTMSERIDTVNKTNEGNSGTSTVRAEFEQLITGYVELNIWNGLYAKYGYMEMDVETQESLHTDSTYPNATMDGTTYGMGWKGSFDNGVFIKTETMMQDWTDLRITASSTGGDDNKNTVDASLRGIVAQISIGKAF